MKQISKNRKIAGWLFFLMAIGLFCIQMGYFVLRVKYDVEYADNRIFFLLNILIVIFMGVALFLLLSVTKKWKVIITSIIVMIVVLQGGLLVSHSSKIKHVVSISPDFRHVNVIKENRMLGRATYYRTYFGIFARPKEELPYNTKGAFKVKWLEKDIAAVTYLTPDGGLHQYIGTYGDRNGGYSYSYVGPSIQGQWEWENVRVSSAPEGITIDYNGEMESFNWENTVQFGTIALVLTENNQAKWTIALNGNFKSNSNEPAPPTGEISLYKVTMDENEPIKLEFVTTN
ncbi:hypothetical protein V7124_20350 [Neobacillus niacini]|uniref:hypothetical protein n=1 Tax=Neobacillus niacini TaxID=86668 RepID=UPI002FFFFC52